MTVFSHGIMAGLITYKITKNLPVSIISGVIGAVPDLARIYDRLFRKDNKWYEFFHLPWWNKGLMQTFGYLSWIIPPIGLHELVDYTCHDKQRWNIQWWAFLYESIFWGIVLYLWFGLIGSIVGIAVPLISLAVWLGFKSFLLYPYIEE